MSEQTPPQRPRVLGPEATNVFRAFEAKARAEQERRAGIGVLHGSPNSVSPEPTPDD